MSIPLQMSEGVEAPNREEKLIPDYSGGIATGPSGSTESVTGRRRGVCEVLGSAVLLGFLFVFL